jgi:hypothetical protein
VDVNDRPGFGRGLHGSGILDTGSTAIAAPLPVVGGNSAVGNSQLVGARLKVLENQLREKLKMVQEMLEDKSHKSQTMATGAGELVNELWRKREQSSLQKSQKSHGIKGKSNDSKVPYRVPYIVQSASNFVMHKSGFFRRAFAHADATDVRGDVKSFYVEQRFQDGGASYGGDSGEWEPCGTGNQRKKELYFFEARQRTAIARERTAIAGDKIGDINKVRRSGTDNHTADGDTTDGTDRIEDRIEERIDASRFASEEPGSEDIRADYRGGIDWEAREACFKWISIDDYVTEKLDPEVKRLISMHERIAEEQGVMKKSYMEKISMKKSHRKKSHEDAVNSNQLNTHTPADISFGMRIKTSGVEDRVLLGAAKTFRKRKVNWVMVNATQDCKCMQWIKEFMLRGRDSNANTKKENNDTAEENNYTSGENNGNTSDEDNIDFGFELRVESQDSSGDTLLLFVKKKGRGSLGIAGGRDFGLSSTFGTLENEIAEIPVWKRDLKGNDLGAWKEGR